MLQSEIWHRKAMLVFDWLSLLQSEGGEVGSALETTIRWVALDLFNETAHRRLIQLHFAAGDRAAALRAYRDCQAILAEELNAEPAPETTALAERIRSESPPPNRGATAAREAALPLVTAEPPLVGRMAQHLELVTAYRLARRGRPQAVTIEGEPGIGKTRLAKEFLAWASAQGADVWHGRAYEMGGLLPYQPVVEVLRQCLGRMTNLPQVLSDTWLAELSRLLPELSDRNPDLPAPLKLNEAEARTRLFEAVARFGQALADQAPVVILLDDLQWADAASLDVLHYLAGRWGDEGVSVLLLFTARSEDLSRPIANAPPDAPILSSCPEITSQF
jgi:predicted ATPase